MTNSLNSYLHPLGGDRFTKIKNLAVDWYVTKRQEIIAMLEDGVPYGSVQLQPGEQLMRFIEMQPDDWVTTINQLYDRYRGMPDIYDRVNKDIAAYVRAMVQTAFKTGE